MTGVQLTAFIVVALTGTTVPLVRDPLRQTIALSVYGLTLTILFFVLQAPDVALSEIVVAAALPVMILLALRKIGQQADEQDGDEEDGR